MGRLRPTDRAAKGVSASRGRKPSSSPFAGEDAKEIAMGKKEPTPPPEPRPEVRDAVRSLLTSTPAFKSVGLTKSKAQNGKAPKSTKRRDG